MCLQVAYSQLRTDSLKRISHGMEGTLRACENQPMLPERPVYFNILFLKRGK